MRTCILQSGLHADAKTWAHAGPWQGKYLLNTGNFKHNLRRVGWIEIPGVWWDLARWQISCSWGKCSQTAPHSATVRYTLRGTWSVKWDSLVCGPPNENSSAMGGRRTSHFHPENHLTKALTFSITTLHTCLTYFDVCNMKNFDLIWYEN